MAASGLDELDPELSELGHRQAQVTAESVTDLKGARLVVSPLRRTRETAAPIAALFEIEPEVRSEVSEVFASSMTPDERKGMLGPFMAGRWSEQTDELKVWRGRLLVTLDGLAGATDTKGGDAVIVSHYIAIAAAIGSTTGDDRVVPSPIANCSITRLSRLDGRLTLFEAASVAHLNEGLVTGTGQALPGTSSQGSG